MKKEFFIASIFYFVTIYILLMVVYHFLQSSQFGTLNFFIAGALVLLVALGWGYVISSLIFAPKKNMDNTLTTLTDNIIHELNIPLSTIQANTHMLLKSLDEKKAIKHLQRINNASLRLQRLYDELTYAIKKEMHEIEKESFDLSHVLKERICIFEDQQRNSFKLDISGYMIKVDKIGFEQMIDNLITNAMKYSKKEAIIEIYLNNHILTIKDHGIGMTSHELLRVHERYFKGDKDTTGKGIGLSLVKSYCEKENIEISILSEKNIGTFIHLNLKKVHI